MSEIARTAGGELAVLQQQVPAANFRDLIQAFENAAQAGRIKNLPNLVEHGIARTYAERGVEICTSVDFEAIDKALKDMRSVIRKFTLAEFETFRDSLPSVVRAGEKATVSSAAACETLCTGHAHLEDHRDNMKAQADKFKKQALAEKQTAAEKWAAANGWWWASAAMSATGVGACLWFVHNMYAGQASEAEHKAATLTGVETAFNNILEPAFAKLSAVFFQNAAFFGEQKTRMEDFVEEGNLALQGPGSDLHQYFYSMKSIMREVNTALSHFETGLKIQAVEPRPRMGAIQA